MKSVLKPPSTSVFTLQSIKSRIETTARRDAGGGGGMVFTLQSIKSRIETTLPSGKTTRKSGFLLYSPLNQGLKLHGVYESSELADSFYSTVH